MPRALILKLGAIGDCIMVLPAAHALHRQGYEIDWVCGDSIAPILRLYPWINVIPADERSILRGSVAERSRSIFALWRSMPTRSYDLCATLYYDSRYRLLALPIRARRKILLSHQDRSRQLIPGRHHADEYLRILTSAPDGENPHRLAPVPPPSLPATQIPAQPGRRRIVLAPAGARNLMRDDALRRWPVESYAALASLLCLRGHEVVLLGGPDDTWASSHFTHLPLTDLIGKLPLVETLSLLDSAAVTVTHDTGPLHLAGITSTAIVTLFGPTDPRGRLPQRPNAVALWGGEDFACRPCYDGRDFAACSHNGCIRQITPDLALAEVERLLAARAQGRTLPPIIRGGPPAASAA